MYNEHESDEVDTPIGGDTTSLIVNWKSLHEKIIRLEQENSSLRREAVCTSKEIEVEEKRELLLIRDCAKQLSMFSHHICLMFSRRQFASLLHCAVRQSVAISSHHHPLTSVTRSSIHVKRQSFNHFHCNIDEDSSADNHTEILVCARVCDCHLYLSF